MEKLDVFDLWTAFNGLVNSTQGGFYPPVTVFMSAVNTISKQMWDEKNDMAENNQDLEDDLFPFIATKNCVVVNKSNSTFGYFDYPSDYGAYSAARMIMYKGEVVEGKEECGNVATDDETKYELIEKYLDSVTEVNVIKISNSKWASCLSSTTKAPTLEKPKILQTSTGIKVCPRKIGVIVLDYYTQPVEAVFAYDTTPGNLQTGSGDQIIYNKEKSTQLQWSSTLIDDFLWRLAERFGITTKDTFLTQYAASKIKK